MQQQPLAAEARTAVLALLADGPRSVGELADLSGLPADVVRRTVKDLVAERLLQAAPGSPHGVLYTLDTRPRRRWPGRA